jgi:hypothetical protein
MSVVARNIGRLGNNMFQIGASIGYAKKYGHQWAADFGNGLSEPYSSIHKVFPNLPKAELSGNRYHEHPNEFCRLHNQHKDICHFDYHPIPDLGPNVALTGFFQSWKYFDNAQEEVKKVFELSHIEGYEDYVSIHVRRGDYVQHSGSFPPINEIYIYNAMGEMAIKGMRKFIFFSDDIQWCKDLISKGFEVILNGHINLNLNTNDFIFEFFEPGDERLSLSTMASCGHHIIANSTFSWWAAYLGHNPDRIVISPSAETWFGPTSGVKKPVVDLLPDSWIKIPTR